jgi:hypothetical protein
MGTSTFCNTPGSVQACIGIALPLPLPLPLGNLSKSQQNLTLLIFRKTISEIPCNSFSAERVQVYWVPCFVIAADLKYVRKVAVHLRYGT